MLDHLRQVIGFRGYAQRDPLNEYKTEAFELFQAMLTRLREAVTAQLMRVEIVQRPPPLAPEDDLRGAGGDPHRPATGENEMAEDEAQWRRGGTVAQRQRARRRRGGRRRADRPQEPGDLGQGPAQRPLPVRLGQEIQALPRPLAWR